MPRRSCRPGGRLALTECHQQRTHALPVPQLPFPVDLKSRAIAISPRHVRLTF